MDYVEVNYALNEVYRVEKNALLTLIQHAVQTHKELRFLEARVEMHALSSLVAATVRVKLARRAAFDEVVPRIAQLIEDRFSNLLNSKPKNVAVIVNGRF